MTEHHSNPQTASTLPFARYRRFESFREYESLLDAMVPRTESVIRIFDRMLSRNWNEQSRIELLRQFLLRDRANKLLITLHHTDNIARGLPRLADLIGHFGHAIKIRQTPRIEHHIYDPFVISDASHYLHRFHYAHMRAAEGNHDVEGSQQLLDRHTELWEVSAPVAVTGASGL